MLYADADVAPEVCRTTWWNGRWRCAPASLNGPMGGRGAGCHLAHSQEEFHLDASEGLTC